MRNHLPTRSVTANIVYLPKRTRRLNRLSPQDCGDIAAWCDGLAQPCYTVQFRIDPDEDEEIGDFVSIYRKGENWGAWGVARRGLRVLLWRCADGADIGLFATMEKALAAIPCPVQDRSKARSSAPELRHSVLPWTGNFYA